MGDPADDLESYARRRVAETCAAQGIDITPPEHVLDVAASMVGAPVEVADHVSAA